MQNFDYVIVGAGSAGCVLANRLSADPAVKVLLIEAGGENRHPFIHMPRGMIKLWSKPGYTVSSRIESQLGRAEEVWRYGRGLGGSSAINGTWYLRGLPSDYDEWASHGVDGWSWEEIERQYRKIENYREPGADPSRGRDGELEITLSPYRSKFIEAVLEAGQQKGLGFLPDINAPGATGIGYTQSTVDRHGSRASAYTAFVKPVRHRRNLAVRTGLDVRRVTFDGTRATGVEAVDSRGEIFHFVAEREVVVSAGVFGSPKLLQLSGVGPAELLEQHGIPRVAALDGVGRNFADHISITLTYRLAGEFGLNREFSGWRLYRNALRYYLGFKGLMAFTGVPVTALIPGQEGRPEFQIGVAPASFRSSREKKGEPGRSLLDDRPGFLINGFQLRPKSRGVVSIASADHHEPALVSAGWWSHPEDRAKAIELVRYIRDFAGSPALKAFCGDEIVPGDGYRSDEEIAEELKWIMSSGLHGTGTCAMGADPAGSVVDARLRVHGTQRLRVVDCSVFPTQVSANTNGPAMAVASRASELILGDLSKED